CRSASSRQVCARRRNEQFLACAAELARSLVTSPPARLPAISGMQVMREIERNLLSRSLMHNSICDLPSLHYFNDAKLGEDIRIGNFVFIWQNSVIGRVAPATVHLGSRLKDYAPFGSCSDVRLADRHS